MSIFTRVFLSFWAAALTIAVLTALAFATFSPFRSFRAQSIPVNELKACADNALAAQNGAGNMPQQATDACYDGALFTGRGWTTAAGNWGHTPISRSERSQNYAVTVIYSASARADRRRIC